MNEELAKKAAPYMMEAHQKAWLLVMESDRFQEQEINVLVKSLFDESIKFANTIDDHRVSPESSKSAGEVTALRTLVDYVYEAEKQGQLKSLDCFYKKIVPAVKANRQFYDSIVGLLNHFSLTETGEDHSEVLSDLSVLRKILGDSVTPTSQNGGQHGCN